MVNEKGQISDISGQYTWVDAVLLETISPVGNQKIARNCLKAWKPLWGSLSVFLCTKKEIFQKPSF